jgi:hypothetical protein
MRYLIIISNQVCYLPHSLHIICFDRCLIRVIGGFVCKVVDFTLFGARGDEAWQPSETATAATRRQVGRRGRVAMMGHLRDHGSGSGMIITRPRPLYNYNRDNEVSIRQPSITSNYRPSSAPSMMSHQMVNNNNMITNLATAPPTAHGIPMVDYPASPNGDPRKLAFAPSVSTNSPTHGRVRRVPPVPADGSPGGRPIVYRMPFNNINTTGDNDDPQSVAAISAMSDGKRMMPSLPEEAHYEPSEWIPADDAIGHTVADGEITPRGTASVASMAPGSSGGLIGSAGGSPMAIGSHNGRGTHMATPAWTTTNHGNVTLMTTIPPASIMDTVVAVGQHHHYRHDDMVPVPDHVVSVLQDKEWSPTPGLFVLESTLCKAKALYMAHHLCDLGYTVISSLQLRDLTLAWRYLLLLTVPVLTLLAMLAFILVLCSKVNAVMGDGMAGAYDVSWSLVFLPIYVTTLLLMVYAMTILCIGRFCPLASLCCCRRRRAMMAASLLDTSSLLLDPSLTMGGKKGLAASTVGMKKKLGNAIVPIQVNITPTPYGEPHRPMLPPSEDSHQELDSPETRVFTWLYRACSASLLHTITGVLIAILPGVDAVLIALLLDGNTVVPLWSIFMVALIWIFAFVVWMTQSSLNGGTGAAMSMRHQHGQATAAAVPTGCDNWRYFLRQWQTPINGIVIIIWLIQLWLHLETPVKERRISGLMIMIPLWAIRPVDGIIQLIVTVNKHDKRLSSWLLRTVLIFISTLLIGFLMEGIHINAHFVAIPLYPLLLYYTIGGMMYRLSTMRMAFMCHLYLKGVPHFWSKSHLTQSQLDTIKHKLLTATARYTAELGQHNV